MNSSRMPVWSLCRMCAVHVTGQKSLSLYDSSQHHLQWAMRKFGISLDDEDDLPTLVCLSCSESILEWLLCEQRSKKANIFLQSIVPDPTITDTDPNVICSIQRSTQPEYISPIPAIKTSEQLKINTLITKYNLKELQVNIVRLTGRVIEFFTSINNMRQPNNHSFALIENNLIGQLNGSSCDKINSSSGTSSQIACKNHYNVQLEKKTKQIVCCVCGKVFPTLYGKYLHRTSVHKNLQILKCCKCDKTAESYILLQKHFYDCHGEFKQCYQCEFKTTRPYRLRDHISFKHEGGGYVCKYCSRKLSTKYKKIIHEKYAHSNIRRFSCNICCKAYKMKHSLKQHKKIHDSEFI